MIQDSHRLESWEGLFQRVYKPLPSSPAISLESSVKAFGRFFSPQIELTIQDVFGKNGMKCPYSPSGETLHRHQ